MESYEGEGSVPSGFKFKYTAKDDRKFHNIQGTKFITVKDQLLISSGVLTLDSVIGGGLQVGSILLIEEDEYAVFSQYLLRYFLAEGLACKHCLYVASLDKNMRELVSELPSPVDTLDGFRPSLATGDDLKIAWRYKDIPAVQSAPALRGGSTFGHNFDLTTNIPKDVIDNAEISYWPQSGSLEDPYTDLLKDIQELIQKQGHSIDTGQARRTILRIGIYRLGSPLWMNVDQRLAHFMYCLRTIIHSAYATAVITLPAALLQRVVIEQCEHLSNNVIGLESLANNSNPVYSEYNGILKVVKLTSLNTLAPHVLSTRDWAFKLRKRRFVIEKLHLPPELQESMQREQDESSELSCASVSSRKLDF